MSFPFWRKKYFQRLLGHIATSATVTQLGLMSQDGHGAAAQITWPSSWSAAVYSALGQILHSLARSSPIMSVQACCCHNRCLRDRPGRCMQWAHSLGTLDRSLTALAHYLSWVGGCATSPEEDTTVDSGQACVGPDGQNSDSDIHCKRWTWV